MISSRIQSVNIKRTDDGTYTLAVDDQDPISFEIEKDLQDKNLDLFGLFMAASGAFQEHELGELREAFVNVHTPNGVASSTTGELIDDLTAGELIVLRQLAEPAPEFLWDAASETAVVALVGRGLAQVGHGHGNRPVITDVGRRAVRC